MNGSTRREVVALVFRGLFSGKVGGPPQPAGGKRLPLDVCGRAPRCSGPTISKIARGDGIYGCTYESVLSVLSAVQVHQAGGRVAAGLELLRKSHSAAHVLASGALDGDNVDPAFERLARTMLETLYPPPPARVVDRAHDRFDDELLAIETNVRERLVLKHHPSALTVDEDTCERLVAHHASRLATLVTTTEWARRRLLECMGRQPRGAASHYPTKVLEKSIGQFVRGKVTKPLAHRRRLLKARLASGGADRTLVSRAGIEQYLRPDAPSYALPPADRLDHMAAYLTEARSSQNSIQFAVTDEPFPHMDMEITDRGVLLAGRGSDLLVDAAEGLLAQRGPEVFVINPPDESGSSRDCARAFVLGQTLAFEEMWRDATLRGGAAEEWLKAAIGEARGRLGPCRRG